MKLSVKFSMLFLSIFIFVICVFDICLTTFKIHETKTISQDASYYPMNLTSNFYSEIKSNEQMIEEVIKNVVLSKQSDCDIEVRILGVDYENGLLDLSIIQTYRHVNGKIETIEERKTIIIEEEI